MGALAAAHAARIGVDLLKTRTALNPWSFRYTLDTFSGRCQGKVNRYPKVLIHPPSDRKLPPLGQSSGAVVLENVAAVEVAVLVEVVVKRGMDGSELLKCLHVPELRHRPLSSSKRLMRVFGPVVEPATALLSAGVTDHLHRRTV